MGLILKAIVLGIIEGITEFLPVSSTGHLIIAGEILNFEGGFAVLFEVFIQLGAILAVIFFYRKKIRNSLMERETGQPASPCGSRFLVAFFTVGGYSFFLKDFIHAEVFQYDHCIGGSGIWGSAYACC
jgi:undecaprenyl-diphosphatase